MEDNMILTVGWKKGELDFRIRATIQVLSIEEMNAFRSMVMVAIGTAEDMWRRARSEAEDAASAGSPSPEYLANFDGGPRLLS